MRKFSEDNFCISVYTAYKNLLKAINYQTVICVDIPVKFCVVTLCIDFAIFCVKVIFCVVTVATMYSVRNILPVSVCISCNEDCSNCVKIILDTERLLKFLF